MIKGSGLYTVPRKNYKLLLKILYLFLREYKTSPLIRKLTPWVGGHLSTTAKLNLHPEMLHSLSHS